MEAWNSCKLLAPSAKPMLPGMTMLGMKPIVPPMMPPVTRVVRDVSTRYPEAPHKNIEPLPNLTFLFYKHCDGNNYNEGRAKVDQHCLPWLEPMDGVHHRECVRLRLRHSTAHKASPERWAAGRQAGAMDCASGWWVEVVGWLGDTLGELSAAAAWCCEVGGAHATACHTTAHTRPCQCRLRKRLTMYGVKQSNVLEPTACVDV